MAERTAEAEWKGNFMEGQGRMKFGSGAFDGKYDFRSRFENGAGTNPEELLGAAHAGCFSMALSAGLSKAGYAPKRVHTQARVHLAKQDSGFTINRIDLTSEAEVPGITPEDFQAQAQAAKAGCPVSKALAGVDIHLKAKLV